MLFDVFFGAPLLDPFLYNCSNTSISVQPNYEHGLTYLLIGLITQFLYVLVLKTIWKSKSLWEHGCYRIMFFLGIPDFLSLIVAADFAGYWSIMGLHPCYNMELSYLLGCFVFGTWHMSCFYVLILAFNRSCELVAPRLGKKLFNGWPLYTIISLPTFYFIYFTFFTKPLIYDPTISTFLLNPNTNSTIDLPAELYTVYGFIFNNFFVMFFIGVNYITVCSFLIYHSLSTSLGNVSKIYLMTTFQCMIVCTCHFIGCFLYIYMQYYSLPQIFHTIAQLAWIGNHGLPPCVYIMFNKTLRSKIFEIFNYKIDPNSTKAESMFTRRSTNATSP